MTRRLTTVASVLACAATFASTAHAQRRRPAAHPTTPPASAAPAAPVAPVDPSIAQARSEYDAGRQSMDAHRYDEALQHFQRAYELRSNPVVLLPIAQAQVQLNHYADAIATLEHYLRDRADAPDRAQIEAQIADLRGRQSTLHVVSAPAGGHIFVDGVDTTQTTPADIRVDPGHHAVRVDLEGHVAGARELDTTASARADIALTLAPEATTTTTDTATTTTTTTATTTAVVTTSRGPHPAVWVATGLAAAGIITGTVFGIMALNDHADYEQHPTVETRDRGETNALVSDITFGVGILSAAVGVVVWLSTPEERAPAHALRTPHRTGVRVYPAPNGVLVSF